MMDLLPFLVKERLQNRSKIYGAEKDEIPTYFSGMGVAVRSRPKEL